MTLQTSTPKTPVWLHPTLWLLVCLLAALVQIPWAGYQLGVGNQGIQLAFLEKLHDGELFKQDLMVQDTLLNYPSFFFHLIARLLAVADFPALYLGLHIVTTTGVFAAVVALSRAMTRNFGAAIFCLLMLLAGHHQALAGEMLYSPGFTHTWAVFPLSLLALYLFFRDFYAMAFLLVGLIFNFHALEAGHLVLIMGFAALLDIRRMGWQLFMGVGLFLLAAMPTLTVILHQMRDPSQHLDAAGFTQWLDLMHIRSADHSFPSSWWSDGTPDIPRFACVLGLGAVALGYRLPRRMKRRTLLLVAGIGLLFVAGTVFTEVMPLSLAIRAQFFRSSRLLMVLALILIANGAALAVRMPFARPKNMSVFHAWLECLSALFTVACLAIPPSVVGLPLALLPVALLLALLVALTSGRLAWYEALVAGAALLVCVVAYQTIHFVLPGTSAAETAALLMLNPRGLPGAAGWGLLIVAGALVVIAQRRRFPRLVPLAAVGGGALVGLVALVALAPGLARSAEPAPGWAQAQRWAATRTPRDAVFLTPTLENNNRLYSWRVYSQRAVVGEWRDGTQLYFSADFAGEWWKRMNALQPGMVVDATGRSRINRGKPLDQMDDEAIVKLAQTYHASYVVLPTNQQHYLQKAYSNEEWTIFLPQFAAPPDMQSDAALPEENRFLIEHALPGIEKYRKSDAQVRVLDVAGRPVESEVTIAQTSSAFGFGASLSFFKVPEVDTKADYKPPAVTPRELSRFSEAFNYSVIPFSGQWRFMEPAKGAVDYTDLDMYVDWCAKNGVRPEFRFVAGFQPAWMRSVASPDQAQLIGARAEALARRYGTRIADWQVTSEEIGVKNAPAVFTKLRQLMPDARLGISDDARFWSARPGASGTDDMQRGLSTLRDLNKQGVRVDYFALEAKHPEGLWAGGRQIYDLLDAYAKEGVKIHITEFGIAVGDRIEGSTAPDGRWTDKQRADYYERFFTICYSHPAVEAINVMGLGPKIWMDGQGLLQADGEPTATFERLRTLLTTKWRTRLTQKPAAGGGGGGQINFRGFQGGYEVSVALPGGKIAKGSFELVDTAKSGVDSAANHVTFQLDAAAGTLKKAGEH